MSYDAAEVKNAESGSGETKIVLVEVDEMENLRTAYPNYFGDVQKFKSKLRSAAGLPENLDRSIPAQERVPKKKQCIYDLSWLTYPKAHTYHPSSAMNTLPVDRALRYMALLQTVPRPRGLAKGFLNTLCKSMPMAKRTNTA